MNKNLNNNCLQNSPRQMLPDCMVTGFGQSDGLDLDFQQTGNGPVTATFQCSGAFEGYRGILHGGIIATILDSAMGHCLFESGRATVTVEMTTRFRHPVHTNKPATVTARIVRDNHPLYLLEAEIVQEGLTRSQATAKFFHIADDLTGQSIQEMPCDTQKPY